MSIKSKIRTIPDYPKQGVMFRDITTLLKDPIGLKLVIDDFTERYAPISDDIEVIVGIEARGFILASALAYSLGKGFVPIRKSGKLPFDVISQEYKLEYGTDKVEIHVDAIEKGGKVLLVDDLIATGGTALASAALIEKLGASVIELAFIIDLPDLGGSAKLIEKGYKVYSQTEFEGE